MLSYDMLSLCIHLIAFGYFLIPAIADVFVLHERCFVGFGVGDVLCSAIKAELAKDEQPVNGSVGRQSDDGKRTRKLHLV